MTRLLVAILVTAAPALAGTYYVNSATGNDSRSAAEAQNESTPWLTIQTALDTVTTGTQHTIRCTGTFAESGGAWGYLMCSRASLNVIVQGPATLATTHATHCVRVYDNLGSAGRIELKNLTITPASGSHGVYMEALSGEVVIDGCAITAVAMAVDVYPSASASGRKLTIRNSTLTGGTSYCVFAPDVERCVIEDNTIAAGTSNAVRVYGANADKSMYARIARNTITQANALAQSAIFVDSLTQHVVIADNSITFSGATAGIGVQVGKDATSNSTPIGRSYILGNRVRFAGAGTSHGILIGAGANDCLCERNRVDNADIGIVVKVCTEATVLHNLVKAGRGIYIKGATNSAVRNNSVITTGTQGGAIEWTNENGTLANPVKCSVTDNILDASRSSAYAVYNYETTASNEGHHNIRLDRNVYRPGSAGLARLDRTDCATLAALRSKWAGSWTNGGTLYHTDNDANSMVADPLFESVDPQGTRFLRPALASPALRGDNALYLSIGAWQRPPVRPADPIRR